MKTKSWMLGVLAVLALAVATLLVGALWPGAPGAERALDDVATLEAPARAAEQDAVPSEAASPEVRRPAVQVAPEPTRAVVSLRVVDSSGLAVPGAEVLAGATPRGLEVAGATDASGAAELAAHADMRWVCARAVGWAPSPLYECRQGTTELTLQLPQRGAALEVEVYGRGGLPLAGARVFAGREQDGEYRLPDGTTARTVPGFALKTDGLGRAHFAGLAPGWVRAVVSDDLHAAATVFATLEVGALERLRVELESGLIVTGRVLDESGAPVAGASVMRGRGGRSVTSSEDGSYRLEHVSPGKLLVVGPFGRQTEQDVDGEVGAEVRWDPVLPSQPALLGRLVDTAGEPLGGWTVHANQDTWPGWRREQVTQSDGRFVFFAPPEGELRLDVRERAEAALPTLSLPGVLPGEQEVVVEVSTDTGGLVRGRVDWAEGHDQDGALLFLRRETRRDRSRLTAGPGLRIDVGAAGAFAVPDVPAGPYELVLEGGPFGWWRLARFTLAPGETADLGALAAPAPGRLMAGSRWGTPQPTGEASFLLERRADLVTIASFRGSFPEEMLLAPGVYTLQTEVTPGPRREIQFEIRPAEPTEIVVELGSKCRHEVRVRYASGRDPEGVISLLVRRVEDDLVVFSDSVARVDEGYWSVEMDLGSGRYEFVARDEEGLQVRSFANLYTSYPGRQVVLSIGDEAGG